MDGIPQKHNWARLTAFTLLLLGDLLGVSTSPSMSTPLFICEQSSSRDYGRVTETLKRIEDQLNTQKTLSTSEAENFKNELDILRRNASLAISQGEDASAYMQPAQSLQQALSNRISDTSQQGSQRRTKLEEEITFLESHYNGRKGDLNSEDVNHFQSLINQLKNSIEQKISGLDEQSANAFIQKAKEIDSEMRGKLMFSPKSKDKEPELLQKVEKAASPQKDDNDSAQAEPKEETATRPKPRNLPRAVKKPLVPIPKIIERIENELIDFHEKKQIGSFDMDSFTERLLKAKRNLHVMLSGTGRISARQEYVIRKDLEQLREDIHNRVIGKD